VNPLALPELAAVFMQMQLLKTTPATKESRAFRSRRMTAFLPPGIGRGNYWVGISGWFPSEYVWLDHSLTQNGPASLNPCQAFGNFAITFSRRVSAQDATAPSIFPACTTGSS
jgi:hypothetical protein